MKKFTNVLLVDDDPITIMVCDRIMKMTGFAEQVQTKENGQEAIRYIQSIIEDETTFPEIIFLDINMPVMNGWDFLQEFDALKSKIPALPRIFILSSTVDPEDYKRAEEFGTVAGFISKPLTQEHLNEL